MLFSSASTIVMWLPSVLERIRMGDWVARGIGNGIRGLSPPGQPLVQIQPGSAAPGSLHGPAAARAGCCQRGAGTEARPELSPPPPNPAFPPSSPAPVSPPPFGELFQAGHPRHSVLCFLLCSLCLPRRGTRQALPAGAPPPSHTPSGARSEHEPSRLQGP